MLAFSRDSQVPNLNSLTTNTAPLRSVAPVTLSTSQPPASQYKKVDTVPPSGTVPFHRQTTLAAPCCFVHAKPEHVYFLFRGLYTRFWCRLHTISSQCDTILYLTKMFENLLMENDAEVFQHAVLIGVAPATIAFPWMFTAFSTFLAVDQVLLLWDRLIAFDSLELLAVLSAAIFGFRAKQVLVARTPEEIKEVFRELHQIKVVPLMQHMLFS
jgi:hypothetical protein